MAWLALSILADTVISYPWTNLQSDLSVMLCCFKFPKLRYWARSRAKHPSGAWMRLGMYTISVVNIEKLMCYHIQLFPAVYSVVAERSSASAIALELYVLARATSTDIICHMTSPWQHYVSMCMHYMTKWRTGDDRLCEMRCINPRFTNRHEYTKIAWHGRTLSKMEWIYTWTKVRGQASLELAQEKMKDWQFALFFKGQKQLVQAYLIVSMDILGLDR